jgi:hypothetical protein
MAINELKTGDNTPRTKVLANGAIYDMDAKRIVALKPELAVKNTQITASRASEMLANRIEAKRNTIARAAQDAVQSSRLVKAHGSAAWLAEIAQAQMSIATTPDAGVAATKAADWLVNNAGLGERQAVEAGGTVSLGGVADLVAELAGFASSVAALVSGQNRDGFDNNNYPHHSPGVDSSGAAVVVDAAGVVDADAGQAGGEGEGERG